MAMESRRVATPKTARNQRAPRRSQSSRNQDHGVPEVYRDLLRDDALSMAHKSRPPKRRRVALAPEESDQHKTPIDQEPGLGVAADVIQDPTFSNYPVQTVLESSDDSDEESFDWEDVEIGADLNDDTEVKPGESLTIVIGDQNDNSPRVRRKAQKPPTRAEKKLRLDVHKIHITCLLYHVFLRNHWCNDSPLQVWSQCNVEV
jgi:xeroderma pigmentosum group C-complementing protein